MCRMKIIPNEQRPPPPRPIIRQPQLQRPAQVEHKADDEDTETETGTGTGTETRTGSVSMYHPYMGYPISPQQDAQSRSYMLPSPYSAPYPPYSYRNPYYQSPYPQPTTTDPRTELEELTKVTQWKIEYYEMRANQLKKELEQFISIQSKWKSEEEEKATQQHKKQN